MKKNFEEVRIVLVTIGQDIITTSGTGDQQEAFDDP